MRRIGSSVPLPTSIANLSGVGSACEYIETLPSGASEVAYLDLYFTCDTDKAGTILQLHGWCGKRHSNSLGNGRTSVTGRWNPRIR